MTIGVAGDPDNEADLEALAAQQSGASSTKTTPDAASSALVGDAAHEAELEKLATEQSKPAPPAPRDNRVAIAPQIMTDPMSGVAMSDTPAPGATNQDIADFKSAANPNSIVREMAKGMPIIGGAANKFAAGMDAATQGVLGRGSAAPSFSERYGANLGAENAQDTAYEKAHPQAALGANLAGGALATGAAVRAVPGLATAFGMGPNMPFAGRMLLGGASGAGVGAADASIRGQDPMGGAATGLALGAAGPAVGSAIGGAARGIANWATPIGKEIAGMGSMARNWLAGDVAGETPQSLAQAADRVGPSGMVGNMTPGLQDRAGGVANMPGTSGPMRQAYQEQAQGARGRIDQAVTDAIGSPIDLTKYTKDVKAARSAAADPLYDAWRSTSVSPTSELNALQPRLQAAGVAGTAANKMAIDGVPGYQRWFTRDTEGNMTLNTQASPTAQTWDYMKQGLDSKIGIAQRAGDDNTVRQLTGLKQELIGAIDNHPDPNVAGVWQQARQAWADPSSILSAQQKGADAFDKSINVDQFRSELQGMSQPEQVAYLQGARGWIRDEMGNSAYGDTSMRNRLLAPNNQEKVAIMAGPQKAQQLTDTLGQEKELRAQQDWAVNNSVTGGRQQQIAAVQPNPNTGIGGYLRGARLDQPATLVPGLNAESAIHGVRAPYYAQARAQAAPFLAQNDVNGQRTATVNALLNYANMRGANQSMGNATNALITALGIPASQQVRQRLLPQRQ